MITEHKPAPSNRGCLWQIVATGFCFMFGLALIVNIHPDGDGLWFWYAVLFRQHHLLYADMHLALQPFFVLANVYTQDLIGPGWLASKVLAAIQLGVYCVGLLLVCRYIPWKDWQKGILIAAVFGMTITSEVYRFDDYHITTHCFEIYAIYLLLLLWMKPEMPRGFVIAALLGILSGLSTSNRLNDGAALFLACSLVLPCLVQARRMAVLLIFWAATALSLLGVIALTGDSVRTWAVESIIHASKIKGGTGHVLLSPFLFPYNMSRDFLQLRTDLWYLYVIFLVALIAILPRIVRGPDGKIRAGRAILAAAVLVPALLSYLRPLKINKNLRLAECGVIIMLLGITVHVALFRYILGKEKSQWNKLQLLLLLPIWQLIAAGMTSGRSMPEYESAVAFLILLLPISSPAPIALGWRRRAYLAIAGLIALGTLPAKSLMPYAWHHFQVRPLFVYQQWYRHPDFGPMYIEKDQLQFMLPMCQAIHDSGPAPTLLSLPYPYPNYFCNVTPWHGYVQTWYDTSGKQMIDTLDQELLTAPPQWIMYLRGLDTMEVHEVVFGNGKPLPHRELDRIIMGQVVGNHWTVVRRVCFEGANWLLIRTTPPAADEHHGQPNDSDDWGVSCPNHMGY